MFKPLLFLFLLISHSSFSQNNKGLKLAKAGESLTQQKVVYDPKYFKIPYPNGDVPVGKGVCTDVIIRAYRQFGVDLQKEVHLDMEKHFRLYPKFWGRKTPDPNIDHRRVWNLMTFFGRKGVKKPMSKNPADYKPGDMVCWDLNGKQTHIGLVVNKKSADGKRYLIVHNIGGGQVLADCLFAWKIIGHYTYKI
jgi:uncharacterized protein YijF (DUF1287 family)